MRKVIVQSPTQNPRVEQAAAHSELLWPMLEGFIEGWEQWYSKHSKKRIGFMGLLGPRVAQQNVTEIKKWGYTFTPNTFVTPIKGWAGVVSRLFNIDAYFHYQSLKNEETEIRRWITTLRQSTPTTPVKLNRSKRKHVSSVARDLWQAFKKIFTRKNKADKSEDSFLDGLLQADIALKSKFSFGRNELIEARKMLGHTLGKRLAYTSERQRERYLLALGIQRSRASSVASDEQTISLERASTDTATLSSVSDQSPQASVTSEHVPTDAPTLNSASDQVSEASEDTVTSSSMLLAVVPSSTQPETELLATSEVRPSTTTNAITFKYGADAFVDILERHMTADNKWLKDAARINLLFCEASLKMMMHPKRSESYNQVKEAFLKEIARLKRKLSRDRYHPDKHPELAQQCQFFNGLLNSVRQNIENVLGSDAHANSLMEAREKLRNAVEEAKEQLKEQSTITQNVSLEVYAAEQAKFMKSLYADLVELRQERAAFRSEVMQDLGMLRDGQATLLRGQTVLQRGQEELRDGMTKGIDELCVLVKLALASDAGRSPRSVPQTTLLTGNNQAFFGVPPTLSATDQEVVNGLSPTLVIN